MATSLARPPMRARVSRNSTTEPPAITPTSIGWSRTAWMTSIAGAMREAPASRASRVRVRRVFGGVGSRQRHHRRVQGGQAEGNVVENPDAVDGAADLPAAVEQGEAVHSVDGHQREQAEGEQPGGDGAVPARPPEADRHRQQQDVAERVGDRDQALGQAEVGQADVGPDQEDPGEHADAGGDDGGVDQAGGVATGRPAPDEQQQPGGQHRVEGEVEGVGDRGEGDLELEHPLVEEAVGVTDGEQ